MGPASPSSTMGLKGGKTGFDIHLQEMEKLAAEEFTFNNGKQSINSISENMVKQATAQFDR
jgi:hypothetical protein